MVEVVSIDVNNPEMVSVFRRLARDYLKNLPLEERERFIESILSKQGEADRWLLLLKHENEPAGFAHFKIDKDERLGWGFVLEFYISPAKRKMGLGRNFYHIIEGTLKTKGVKNIWLLADQSSEAFWRSLGFMPTGEIDKETGQNIMVKSLKTESDAQRHKL